MRGRERQGEGESLREGGRWRESEGRIEIGR